MFLFQIYGPPAPTSAEKWNHTHSGLTDWVQWTKDNLAKIIQASKDWPQLQSPLEASYKGVHYRLEMDGKWASLFENGKKAAYYSPEGGEYSQFTAERLVKMLQVASNCKSIDGKIGNETKTNISDFLSSNSPKTQPGFTEINLGNDNTAIFRVNGLKLEWRLELTDTYNAILTVNGEEFQLPVPPSLGQLHGEGIIPLKSGTNRIRFVMYDFDFAGNDSKLLNDQSFELTASGSFSTFKSNGIIIRLENMETTGIAGTLERFTKTLATMNLYLKKGYKINDAIIWNKSDEIDGEYGYNEEKKRAEFTVSSGLFRYGKMALDAIFWHEAAHGYYRQLTDDGKISGFEEKTFRSIWNLDKAAKDRVFSVFDESTYLTNLPPEVGHPADFPTELFASGSVVLTQFAKEVMQKIDGLDGDEKALALDAARWIAGQYLGKGIISPELLDYLGMK